MGLSTQHKAMFSSILTVMLNLKTHRHRHCGENYPFKLNGDTRFPIVLPVYLTVYTKRGYPFPRGFPRLSDGDPRLNPRGFFSGDGFLKRGRGRGTNPLPKTGPLPSLDWDEQFLI